MRIKAKNNYQVFSLISAIYIALFAFFLTLVIQYFQEAIQWGVIVTITLAFFVFAYASILVRSKRYIYHSVKSIYDDVKLLESASLNTTAVTTDMTKLREDVKQYAANRKLEIEALEIRENYRKEYLGNVAHEIKTPLFTVQGYILTLLDGAINDINVRDKYLQRAGKGVDRMLYLVNDLDMITKLESGNLNLTKVSFDIVEMIQGVFDLLEMKAHKKNITLTLEQEYLPTYVVADAERIQQVLINLVVNSIKYGLQDGTTELSIQELIENKLIIRVTDNGEGIAQEHLPRLFERFYRVDTSGNREITGSGLGLSIVKHIVEAHEEKIYVESELGVGSEFSFTLEKGEKPT